MLDSNHLCGIVSVNARDESRLHEIFSYRAVATRGHSGVVPPNFFCASQILLRPEVFVSNIKHEQNLTPKNVFCPPNLKAWLRACFHISKMSNFAHYATGLRKLPRGY